ncbi:unnamed protein product [Rotaria socialis]
MLFIVLLLIIGNVLAISSLIQSFTTYKYSIELQPDIADLWWTVDSDANEITFELHMKTTGWIGLGISPGGGMKGADTHVITKRILDALRCVYVANVGVLMRFGIEL